MITENTLNEVKTGKNFPVIMKGFNMNCKPCLTSGTLLYSKRDNNYLVKTQGIYVVINDINDPFYYVDTPENRKELKSKIKN